MPRRREMLEPEAAALARARDAIVRDEPLRRRAHGVVHTPPELARAMVGLASEALVLAGARGGLASEDLVVIDPACGPGAFLAAVLDRSPGLRRARIVGVDIDGDAIGMARGLLAPACEARGIALELVVGDALALEPDALVRPGERALVIGNPPWAARTPLRGQQASEAMLDAFRVDADGAPLGERKIGVLSDAYVRFFRFCAEVVRRAPKGGALALVTNGSFLDGPVHRGMRAALLRWFASIDVIDLGGSALVAASGAGPDENVFGVRPTVAITVAARPAGHGELLPSARTRHARLRGARAAKLEALGGPIVRAPFSPSPPAYTLRPVATPRARPSEGMSLDAMFTFHAEGVQTNRDRAVVAEDVPTLIARLHAFVEGRPAPTLDAARVASAHYDPERARANVREALARDPEGTLGIVARPIAYRPFDTRVYCPVTPLCHRPRADLAAAVAHASLTLVSVRKDRGEAPWLHFGAVRHVPDNCFLSSRSSCRTRAFPSHAADGTSNVTPIAQTAFASRVGREPSPREVVAYALAVLASAAYRSSCGDALRLDYPVIPLPRDADVFARGVDAGEGLAAILLAPAGTDRAKIGHHSIEIAASGLADALAGADRAFRSSL